MHLSLRNNFQRLLILFCILKCMPCSAQWIELNSPGLTQPYSYLPPPAGGQVCFTELNTAYYGTGSSFIYPSTVYNSEFYAYDILTHKWNHAPQISNQFAPRSHG